MCLKADWYLFFGWLLQFAYRISIFFFVENLHSYSTLYLGILPTKYVYEQIFHELSITYLESNLIAWCNGFKSFLHLAHFFANPLLAPVCWGARQPLQINEEICPLNSGNVGHCCLQAMHWHWKKYCLLKTSWRWSSFLIWKNSP